MATHRMSIFGSLKPESGGPFLDEIKNQIVEATAPSLGDVLAWVVSDPTTDIGFYGTFKVPKNYVGSPVIVVSGYFDGVGSTTFGFAFRKRAVADNEAGDATFDAEQTGSIAVTGYTDEDYAEGTITLTAGDYAVDDQVQFYFYLDTSVNDYAGNFLLTELEFEYADA